MMEMETEPSHFNECVPLTSTKPIQDLNDDVLREIFKYLNETNLHNRSLFEFQAKCASGIQAAFVISTFCHFDSKR